MRRRQEHLVRGRLGASEGRASRDDALAPSADVQRPVSVAGRQPWPDGGAGLRPQVPGIPMTEGPYIFAPWKRACLWEDGLKDGVPGYGALCYVRLEGTQRKPGNVWDIVGRQCTGALVVQQREVLRHVERGESALSVQGAARVASDMLGREVAEHESATWIFGSSCGTRIPPCGPGHRKRRGGTAADRP